MGWADVMCVAASGGGRGKGGGGIDAAAPENGKERKCAPML